MSNVVTGWILRRLVELGGFGLALVQLYQALPPNAQQALQAVVSGDRSQQNLILAVGGVVVSLLGYLWSLRATITPHVVTSDGVKVSPKKGSAVEGQIDAVVVGVKPQSLKPSPLDVITGWFSRK